MKIYFYDGYMYVADQLSEGFRFVLSKKRKTEESHKLHTRAGRLTILIKRWLFLPPTVTADLSLGDVLHVARW